MFEIYLKNLFFLNILAINFINSNEDIIVNINKVIRSKLLSKKIKVNSNNKIIEVNILCLSSNFI